jgi:hypothetical protein
MSPAEQKRKQLHPRIRPNGFDSPHVPPLQKKYIQMNWNAPLASKERLPPSKVQPLPNLMVLFSSPYSTNRRERKKFSSVSVHKCGGKLLNDDGMIRSMGSLQGALCSSTHNFFFFLLLAATVGGTDEICTFIANRCLFPLVCTF